MRIGFEKWCWRMLWKLSPRLYWKLSRWVFRRCMRRHNEALVRLSDAAMKATAVMRSGALARIFKDVKSERSA